MHRYAILYVDDNPSHQGLIRQLLEMRLSAVVDLAQTAAGAEELLNRYCYDLLICDVNLSGELGTRIVERVLERDPEQPALILTAYLGEGVLRELERVGVPGLDKLEATADLEGFVSEVAALARRRPCAERDRRLGHISQRPETAELQIVSPHVREARTKVRATG